MSKILKCFFLTIVFIHLLVLSGCEKSEPSLDIHPVSFSELANWNKDTLVEAWPAFVRSCQQLSTLPKESVLLNGRPASDWHSVCLLSQSLKDPTESEVRDFFKTYFIPYRVSDGRVSEGLFTGYYEPEITGSRTKTEKYQAPLYKRPKDLITIEDLGIFNQKLKGIRIAGRVVKDTLRPYFTHAEIDKGAIAGNELIWAEDPLDAFFVQIQGSTVIKLGSGEKIRLGFSATNGHPYTAIGKSLIQQKALTPENVSMQSIRAWLKAHPDKAKDILYQNASFVFFKEIKGDGPVGAQGVVLTAGRSLAIDPAYISYGTPIWLDVTHPKENSERIQRLVIAQDRGGAIKGVIRGDLFWGTGNEAGELAGIMKSKGSYYLLLPNTGEVVDPKNVSVVQPES